VQVLLPFACIYVGELKKKLFEIGHIMITALLVEASGAVVGRDGL
jgi:hypothetical protein